MTELNTPGNLKTPRKTPSGNSSSLSSGVFSWDRMDSYFRLRNAPESEDGQEC